MTLPLTFAARAPHPICRDFEADVLAQVQRAGATLHGCPVASVESTIDGAVTVWFAGSRDGVPWRGALRFEFPWLAQRRYAADSNAVAQAALQLLAAIGVKPRDQLPLIRRAGALAVRPRARRQGARPPVPCGVAIGPAGGSPRRGGGSGPT